jgi:hypothetical protein
MSDTPTTLDFCEVCGRDPNGQPAGYEPSPGCDHCVSHLYLVMYGDSPIGLGLCGCGNPEEGFTLVRDLLDLAPFYDNWEAAYQRIGSPGAHQIVLAMLTNADLLSHGGSIGGSWLTPKGEFIRAVFRQVPTDDYLDEVAGFPEHECSEDCWILGKADT